MYGDRNLNLGSATFTVDATCLRAILPFFRLSYEKRGRAAKDAAKGDSTSKIPDAVRRSPEKFHLATRATPLSLDSRCASRD